MYRAAAYDEPLLNELTSIRTHGISPVSGLPKDLQRKKPRPETYPTYDINEDGFINYLDLSLLIITYGSSGPPGWIPEDVNGDGIINYLDLSTMILHYGETY